MIPRMKTRALAAPIALVALALCTAAGRAQAPTSLPPPLFHHLHLNSLDPDAAIAFYVREFPSTSSATFAGQPALKSPNNVWVLFNRVETPPPTQPTTAYWHFGWHVVDVHKNVATYRRQAVTLLPLYTGEGNHTVFASSDTWPGTGGALGLTTSGIAEAKAKGITPSGGAGFAYLQGPDAAIVEYQGNMPAERFNHIHMYEDQPFCAQLWYQQHLNAAPGRGAAPRTDANCRVERSPDKTWPALTVDGMYRTPSVNGTTFGDVSLYMYMNQGDTPLAPTRGQLIDHIALSVANLDAWIGKLRAEQVTFLGAPYTIGDYRAVMIEGPSREAIELIEVK
jgi:catechol 2,3-dioxygenase-like lactoylglutathione lyase family enzyme